MNKFMFGDTEGESIKVVLRVRPMSNMEIQRGDENCTKIISETTTQVSLKGQIK